MSKKSTSQSCLSLLQYPIRNNVKEFLLLDLVDDFVLFSFTFDDRFVCFMELVSYYVIKLWVGNLIGSDIGKQAEWKVFWHLP